MSSAGHGTVEDLACWAWNRLVNRVDVWGGYWVDQEGRAQLTTHPKKELRGRSFLTPAVLLRHFMGRARQDVIGLHSTSSVNTSRWGGLDFDAHGPAGSPPSANLHAALAWLVRLEQRGFHPILEDSDGRGGLHLWLLFRDPIPTSQVYRFFHELISDHASYGLTAPPETFPKQAGLRPRSDGASGYGNWLRIPGRHHTRPHWSRFWGGTDWLEGGRAIDFLLSHQGDKAELPAAPAPVPPRSQARPATGGQSSDAGVAAYMARLPHLGEGQGRDDVAYRFACFLVRTKTLPDHVALEWLQRWDAGNRPPKGLEPLLKVIRNAHLYGRNPIGCGLPPPRGKPS